MTLPFHGILKPFWEDGNESDATDWKWAEHQGFYDKDWFSIDEEEINGS